MPVQGISHEFQEFYPCFHIAFSFYPPSPNTLIENISLTWFGLRALIVKVFVADVNRHKFYQRHEILFQLFSNAKWQRLEQFSRPTLNRSSTFVCAVYFKFRVFDYKQQFGYLAVLTCTRDWCVFLFLQWRSFVRLTLNR